MDVNKYEEGEEDPHLRLQKELGTGGVDLPPDMIDPSVKLEEPLDEVEQEAVAEVVPVPTEATGEDSALAQAMALMSQKIETLEGELADQRKVQQTQQKGRQSASISGYPWMYYKRPLKGYANPGWVIIGPGGAGPSGNRAAAYNGYMSSGFRPLEDYGPCETPTQSDLELYLIPLLQRGGAKEFPADQVVAYGWHRKPPIRGLRFPQIPADGIIHFECEECTVELDGLKGDKITSRASFLHLRTKHQYTRKEANSLLTEQGLEPFGRYAVDTARTVEKAG